MSMMKAGSWVSMMGNRIERSSVVNSPASLRNMVRSIEVDAIQHAIEQVGRNRTTASAMVALKNDLALLCREHPDLEYPPERNP